MHACMSGQTYLCAYTCTNSYIYIYMYMCMYLQHLHVHIHVRIHTYVYMRVGKDVHADTCRIYVYTLVLLSYILTCMHTYIVQVYTHVHVDVC